MSLEDLFVVSENIQALRSNIESLKNKEKDLDSEDLIRKYIRFIDQQKNQF